MSRRITVIFSFGVLVVVGVGADVDVDVNFSVDALKILIINSKGLFSPLISRTTFGD